DFCWFRRKCKRSNVVRHPAAAGNRRQTFLRKGFGQSITRSCAHCWSSRTGRPRGSLRSGEPNGHDQLESGHSEPPTHSYPGRREYPSARSGESVATRLQPGVQGALRTSGTVFLLVLFAVVMYNDVASYLPFHT